MSKNAFRTAGSKVVRRSELARLIEGAKSGGKTVVFTNGCFDILHIGHVRYLQAARSLGDMLVVGINTDDGVRRLKGPGRPLNPEFERAEVLAALECVDYVTLFDEDTPTELILAVKPSIHSKGGDYAPEDLPEAEAVARVGGRVEVIPFSATRTEGISTTGLYKKVNEVT
ncbi:MAG: D-glycero-beta-D-manno-heptose 1-phosphate adenylyltransferase [Armatimonadetes bacterium]|nr:D-glycero-beta-D-manno-heptose 1-phosphate adenylyltransferase [Armatimonadota bacterium]